MWADMSTTVIFLLLLQHASANLNTTKLLGLVDTNYCGSEELCLNSTEYQRRIRCQCDPDCAKYGDCCRDSPFFRSEDVPRKICKAVSRTNSNITTYVAMVGNCPPEWPHDNVREGCLHPKILGDDPLASGIPMTDTSTTALVTYRNFHCAVCNNANRASLQMWKAKLRCDKVKAAQPKGLKLKPNFHNKKWGFSEDGVTYPCKDLIPVLPTNLENLRLCPQYEVPFYYFDKCAPTWKDPTTEALCKSYTAYVFVKNQSYQNAHCATCRKVDLNATKCYQPQPSGKTRGKARDDLTSFQELLDFDFEDSCEKFEVYDPFTKRCRQMFNVTATEKIQEGNRTKSRCTQFVIINETYYLAPDNQSLSVPLYGKTYVDGEFFFNGDILVVCHHGGGGVTGIKSVGGVLTCIGLGISIIFLTLHLCAFALVAELRNLSGRTLASLCVALLMGYVSFIAGDFIGTASKPFCAITSVAIYYFFLSAFTWMLVIGFDVWRALVQAVHFQSCRGGQWHRFFAYSAFAWLTPAIMTGLAIAADNAPDHLVNRNLRPGFAVTKCWFSHRISMMIFFGAPLALIMVLNVGFFTSAAWMTMGTRPCGMSAGASGAKRDFRLYLRLAVMVGLTWVVGFIANVLHYTALWFAFIILNTLQGLFIFAMFTCTAKVFRGLEKAMPWTESFRYSLSSQREKRSTKTSSWTGASNDTLQDSAIGSGSDKEQNPELNSLFHKSKTVGK